MRAPSPRPADAQDPGTTEVGTFGAFPYLIYTPSTYDAKRPAPLLVMAHGCQTTAEQQMRANLYNAIAERERFVVLYPDVSPTHVAQPGPLTRCWQFFLPTSWSRDSGDAAAIAGMTRAVIANRAIDAERVYLMGMSAGGFMTSIMAAAYPDLYAAVGIMAAGSYANPGCLAIGPPLATPTTLSAQLARQQMGTRARVVPRLVMGGDKDAGIPPSCHAQALEQGLRTNNLVLGDSQTGPIALAPAQTRAEPKPDGYPSTVRTYRDPAGCIVGEYWTIHGMNHFWTGGSADPRWKSFTDPKGPSGAEISWRFFSRYTKSATSMPCAETPVPPPAAAAKPRCARRSLLLSLPKGSRAVSVTLNGRPVSARRVRGRLRVQLPATRRTKTVVTVRARTRAGKRVTRRHAYKRCGPKR